MIQFTRIHHLLLGVPVGALAEARAFYGGVLGLPEAPLPHPAATVWYLVGGIELHLQEVAEPVGPRSKPHPAFEVTDLAGARQELEARGVAIEPASVLPDGRQRFFVRDPFGNRLELLQLA